jgi:hypothetical protein
MTIAWGVFVFLAVPTSPMQAWFLNEREKKIATARVGIPSIPYIDKSHRLIVLGNGQWHWCIKYSV